LDKSPVTALSQAETGAWESHFRRFLRRAVGGDRAAELASRFLPAIGADYRLRIEPTEGARDGLMVAGLSDPGGLDIDIRRDRSQPHRLRIRVVSRAERPLHECLPWFEHLGLRIHDSVQFKLALSSGDGFVRLLAAEPVRQESPGCHARRRVVVEALRWIADGRLADDPLNGLLASTGLGMLDVDVLRAYRNYYAQIQGTSSPQRVDSALLDNPAVAEILFDYFDARFNPDRASPDTAVRQETLLEPLRRKLSDALGGVGDV
jgi:glutamate dehydrogenase